MLAILLGLRLIWNLCWQNDILSSLATLSFDERRSEFFTDELITLLKLIESNKVNYKSLYGSWAELLVFFVYAKYNK